MPIGKRIRSLFGDPALAFTVFALTIFGIAMVYSAGQLDVPKPGVGGAWRNQVTWFAISLVGMFVVTMLFNVPRNNALDASDPAAPAGQALWARYWKEWTAWNHVRTLASTAALILFVMALAAR